MHAVLRACARSLALALVAWSASAAAQSSTEHQVTTTASLDSLPSFGADAQGTYVVFTSRATTPVGYGPGVLWYQRLDVDGAPSGSAVPVSTGDTDDQLNDGCGKYIVYTAFDSQYVLSGRIMLYDIETATRVVLASAPALREARCFGDYVVWLNGPTAAASVMLFDVKALGTGTSSISIAGPSPSATNPEIGDRLVVWDEFANNQRDVHAYDLLTGTKFLVANDPLEDEWLPATSGGWIVWETRVPGVTATKIEAFNVDTHERRTIVDNGTASYAPTIDGNVVTYESRAAGNFDVYAYRLAEQDTLRVTTNPTDQRLNSVLGDLVTYVDSRAGSMDVYVSRLAPCAANGGDWDGDGVCDAIDNCVGASTNPDQTDSDGDGWGDVCDNCVLVPNVDQTDYEWDGAGEVCDNCQMDANSDQAESDGDGIGDVCDVCPLDPYNDADGDGVCNEPPFAVSPAALSVGDVAVGSSATGRLTISNLVLGFVSLTSIAWTTDSDPAFTITSAPPPGFIVGPYGAIDVEVGFAPTAEGPASARLIITGLGSYPPAATITATLTGNGVASTTPSQFVQELMDDFDAGVLNGSLIGNGPGSSASGRLKALRTMLKATGDLVTDGDHSSACRQLADAMLKVDGVPVPPDFATGPAATEVRADIAELRTMLACD